jgi:hypothetical protein
LIGMACVAENEFIAWDIKAIVCMTSWLPTSIIRPFRSEPKLWYN